VRRLPVLIVMMALAFAAGAAGPASIEPKALNDRIAWADRSLVVLDVRTSAEYADGHIPGAINIPNDDLGKRIAELANARDSDIVVYCRTGPRATQAIGVLQKQGFKRVYHLAGDYTRWSEEKRPVVKPQ
jgi:rhodanese-related sulfurtransferase